MLYTDYITELLDLKEVNILKQEILDDKVILTVEYNVKPHACPQCGYITSLVHDYRIHTVIDIPFQNKKVIIKYNKRRYRCPCCNKRFDENQLFAPKNCQYSSRMNYYLLTQLSSKCSIADVAKNNLTSCNKLFRLLNEIHLSNAKALPEVLSIDEFRGNAGRKFQCILTDPVRKEIIDILPGRESHILTAYFRGFPKSEREKVKYFVMDMNKEYLSIAKAFFPKATIIIDKFHFARYNNWSLENMRKKCQKNLLAEERKYFKKSRKLLNMRAAKLNNDGVEAVALMLKIAPDLCDGYFLKEKFYAFSDSDSFETAKQRLKEFIFHASTLNIPEYKPTITMLLNWSEYILNSFKYHYSNAYTEGMNNKIKVLKRVAFGFRNFENLRKRILLLA